MDYYSLKCSGSKKDKFNFDGLIYHCTCYLLIVICYIIYVLVYVRRTCKWSETQEHSSCRLRYDLSFKIRIYFDNLLEGT